MATASFVTYLQKPRELRALEFRAPPPSPVTGVLTSSSSGSPEYGDGNEDDEVSQFLQRSARVPVLRLPERAIPRKPKKNKAAWVPPVIDMRLLEASGPVVEALRSAAVAFGCFQVVGHGVDGCLVSAATVCAAAEGRAGSPAPDEEEAGGEDGEELWWSPREGDQPRTRADDLFTQMKRTAAKIMDALQRDSVGATNSLARAERNGSSLLCIRTHHRKQRDSGSTSGPISQDEILRMLIKSSRCPRALALHLCPGASTFHVFSRRGCSSFRPLDGAVVVTVGDQLQAWSSGLYKSVAGKPAYSNDDLQGGGGGAVVSAEFLHSCSSAGMAKEPPGVDAGKIIPLNLQIMVAACILLVYHHLLPCLYAIW